MFLYLGMRRGTEFSKVFLWIGALIALQGVVVLFTESAYRLALFEEAVVASILLLTAILVGWVRAAKPAIKAFGYVLIGVGVLTAATGLIKQVLLLHGFVLPWLEQKGAAIPYPAGTSLSVDYNDTATTWLCAAVLLFPGSSANPNIALRIAGASLVVAALLGCGSRRGLIMLAAVPALVWVCCLLKSRLRNCGNIFLRMGTVFCGGITLLFFAFNAPAAISDCLAYNTPAAYLTRLSTYQPPDARPSTIAKLIRPDMANSRVERITIALPIFTSNLFSGVGFQYHNAYGAVDRDYPHLRFLTEGLIGGVFYGLNIIALFSFLWFRSVRIAWASENECDIKLAIVFSVVSVFWLLSGDTWLSVAQWMSVSLLLILRQLATNTRAK